MLGSASGGWSGVQRTLVVRHVIRADVIGFTIDEWMIDAAGDNVAPCGYSNHGFGYSAGEHV